MPGSTGAADVRTNLIINYLHQSTTDEDLMSLFSTIGVMQSARVIMDKVRGHSLQYGFVNYMHHADAARAVETLNRQKLQSKAIKVSYAQKRSPAAVKDTKTVADGPPKTVSPTDEELEQRFSSMILDDVEEAKSCPAPVKVKAEEAGQQQPHDQKPSPGASLQQADEASLTTIKQEAPPTPADQHSDQLVVEAMDNFSKLQLCHQHLQIPPGPSDQRPDNAEEAEEAACKRLIDQEPVKPFFCKSLYPTATVTSSPQCEAKHRSDGKAEQQRKHHQGGTGNGVQLRRSPRIFVYNLGQDDDEDVLLQMFGNFGVVTDVKVFRDLHTNKCRGLAFVTMATYKQAVEAIARLNGQPLGDNILNVSFKIQDKKERQAFSNHVPDFQHKERAVFKLSDNSIHVTVQNKKRARYTLDNLERDGHGDNHHYDFTQPKRQRAARMC